MFMSDRLNQDPLESFFGKQRQKGGGSDHSTVAQFINTTSSLRAQGSVSIHPLRGNCRKRPMAPTDEAQFLKYTPIPKCPHCPVKH